MEKKSIVFKPINIKKILLEHMINNDILLTNETELLMNYEVDGWGNTYLESVEFTNCVEPEEETEVA